MPSHRKNTPPAKPGPDEIRMEEDELSEAGWFHRDSLPEDHSDISLTGEMIELFRAGGEPRG